MQQLGANPKNTLFVGDSNVDILTAKNAGLASCGVLWGFRDAEELTQAGADFLAADVEDLYRIIFGQFTHQPF
ncbi:phosphoglycolate phosphatase [gut metagenome]|uniref:Phosphoglycolate phosphatase n=1 Tax=gut metagenome TaxID=749906 RepID=J9FGN4_9ZZZZ